METSVSELDLQTGEQFWGGNSPEDGEAWKQLDSEIKQIMMVGKRWHEMFDFQRQIEQSWHNPHHLLADWRGWVRWPNQSEDSQLGRYVQDSLQSWRQANPDKYQLQIEDLKAVFGIVAASHDWGNIMKMEKGEPQFLEGYVAKGAEDRSREILKWIREQAVPKDDPAFLKWAAMGELADHLIAATEDKNQAVLNQPFGLMVKLIDGGIGSWINRKSFEEQCAGLNEEIIGEKGTPMSQLSFDSFAEWRVKKLCAESGRLDPDQVWELVSEAERKVKRKEVNSITNTTQDFSSRLNISTQGMAAAAGV